MFGRSRVITFALSTAHISAINCGVNMHKTLFLTWLGVTHGKLTNPRGVNHVRAVKLLIYKSQ